MAESVVMRVLIAYASRRGGTTALAAMIGDAFADQGWDVDVCRARDLRDLLDVDVVVVVSAVYMGRWLPDARRFVKRFSHSLRDQPVWLVSSGPLTDTVALDMTPPRTARHLMKDVGARAHVTFGGRLDPDARGFPAHAMTKTKAGDYRDPQQVRAWVASVVSDCSKPGVHRR